MEEKLIENKEKIQDINEEKIDVDIECFENENKKVITRTIYVRSNINWYELLFLIVISTIIMFLTILFCMWIYEKLGFL